MLVNAIERLVGSTSCLLNSKVVPPMVPKGNKVNVVRVTPKPPKVISVIVWPTSLECGLALILSKHEVKLHTTCIADTLVGICSRS